MTGVGADGRGAARGRVHPSPAACAPRRARGRAPLHADPSRRRSRRHAVDALDRLAHVAHQRRDRRPRRGAASGAPCRQSWWRCRAPSRSRRRRRPVRGLRDAGERGGDAFLERLAWRASDGAMGSDGRPELDCSTAATWSVPIARQPDPASIARAAFDDRDRAPRSSVPVHAARPTPSRGRRRRTAARTRSRPRRPCCGTTPSPCRSRGRGRTAPGACRRSSADARRCRRGPPSLTP